MLEKKKNFKKSDRRSIFTISVPVKYEKLTPLKINFNFQINNH